jgi:hypothetical protein
MKASYSIGTLGAVCCVLAALAHSVEMRTIERNVLEDKIRGGWVGQMVGVAYGLPTEFKWCQKIVEGPLHWEPSMATVALNEDDLYVEMTFAAVMDTIGIDATSAQYGEAFRDSKYSLWHANAGARRNLNNGIAAPDSGHPKYNMHANDIDFQIESDFIGLMAPGLPQVTIDLCDRVGRVMNSGDGLYGGMFVTGMYSAAFFEKDPEALVRAGMACIPEESTYYKTIANTVAAFKEHPDDWQACWAAVNAQWDKNESCPNGPFSPFNIDASLNGAYIAIGLLYGGGDFDKTLEIATRCGQDSDCNPASAGGILGVVHGYSGLDAKWTDPIVPLADTKFAFTDYNLHEIVASTMKRAEAAVIAQGGRVEGDTFHIPVQTPKPPALEQWSMGVPTALVKPNDPAWTWRGTWANDADGPVGDVQTSESGGDEAELQFTGTGVAVVGKITPEMGGMLAVYLDGEAVGTANCYIPADTWDTAIYHVYGLEEGPHTLRLVTLDEVDPRSQGKLVRIDDAKVFSASQ